MFKYALYIVIIFFTCTSQSNVETNLIFRTDINTNRPALPEENTNLNIMWWNLGCSSTRISNKVPEEEKENYDPKSQWHNISSVINRKNLSPDLLLFGEFCPRYFNSEVHEEIKKLYPHSYFFQDSKAQSSKKNGLRVFSKHPLHIEKENFLPGAPSKFLKDCPKKIKQRYSSTFKKGYWKRPFSLISVEKNNKTYHIAPVHLANPWRIYKACKGPLKTGLEIVTGLKNPNFAQVKALKKYLGNTSNLILIGDFNASKKIMGFISNSYKHLSSFFQESVISEETPTYIDSSNQVPATSIDHVFVSQSLVTLYAEVLPLSGSDHLPLYISVN